MDACRWSGTPLVVHFHGYDAYMRADALAAACNYPALFQTAAALVVVSKHMRERLLGMGASEQKLFLNPYGVESTMFSGAAPAGAQPLFIAVGRFVEKKAPLLTLAAFWKTLRGCPEAELLMVGDGPLLTTARQWVHGMGMEQSVTFAGALDHSEVALHMRQARAFVQHSVCAANGDHEGMPVAVLEASACGLPVVATQHGGIPDAVVDGETGLLCREYDVDGMAQHMLRLATDRGLAAALGAAGRKRIAAEFSIKKSIEGLWRVLCAAAHKWRESERRPVEVLHELAR
jgi:glycosyltransferase involved in cell wall biosynthesis